jgi:hypothetical protein
MENWNTSQHHPFVFYSKVEINGDGYENVAHAVSGL